MKSNSSFNLSKTSKKMLATTPKKIRSIFKNMMIQAELAAALRPVFKDRQPKPVKETPSDQTNN
jgi:hypothetical protein